METENGNAPAVHHLGIDLAVAVLVGDHLAATREPDVGAVVAAIICFELFPVAAATGVILDAAHEAEFRHTGPAPDLDVIAAREVELLVVEPTACRRASPVRHRGCMAQGRSSRACRPPLRFRSL